MSSLSCSDLAADKRSVARGASIVPSSRRPGANTAALDELLKVSDTLLKVTPHPPSTANVDAKPTKWLGESSQDLCEIQQSVDRLKLQRLQVEHIRNDNERLEAELHQKIVEIGELRVELEHLQDVEADNERLRSRVLQVEGKLERLDAAFRDQRQELEDALDTRVALESRWREAAETLQKAVDETTRTYQGKLKTMEEDLEKRAAKIVRLEEAIEETKAVADHRESKLEHKISQVEAMNVALEKQTATGNASWEAERARLLNELANAEKKIAALVATTARQTTMIHECDRAIADSEDRMTKFLKRKTSMNKAQAELEATIQALEGQIQLQQAESAHQAQTLQALLHGLETKCDEKDKKVIELTALVATIDQRNESNHQEHVKRERHRFYLDEQNKALLKREKKMQGDMTELSMALRDMADEKRVLEDKVKSLLAQLELEREDRTKWASSRMKLLAQFCDEENKLTSSLNAHVSSAYNHRK
ncbi:hypothetical protein H310_01535 [Aphanomyces invadans]|uniref:Uncharacterized protein n=1 Tax=Aphanomyces invadans TaxID=157072 RepID=A0A024USZ3_9STRA|nr:hypothetical protein H310_01535 [Aphanomyces invadans]ETW09075.1 hypothetical protein H310_01535 [Aphanomyces invadans]|eukprot:XP_008862880.1 hypothetical protein H310_01535 [Aphanomyces invadans]